MSETSEKTRRRGPLAFVTGAVIGTLGGLIGLGGAEFRLPLLITLFRFRGLEAVILNKAVSLVVVATALPFRTADVSFAAIGEQSDRWFQQHYQPGGPTFEIDPDPESDRTTAPRDSLTKRSLRMKFGLWRDQTSAALTNVSFARFEQQQCVRCHPV
jgi:hypothetical protein